MRKAITFSLLIISIIFFNSCKKTIKKDGDSDIKTYSINANNSSIKWTAYKTTSKIPVNGEFTSFEVDETKKGDSPLEVLNNLKFNIPIASLYTADTIRDAKLKKFFFGSMQNTASISGEIFMNNDTSGTVGITMNGITHSLPISTVFTNQSATIEATMDLDNWQAQAAIKALNVVCSELHTGNDGISKTWNEVKINIVASFKKEE